MAKLSIPPSVELKWKEKNPQTLHRFSKEISFIITSITLVSVLTSLMMSDDNKEAFYFPCLLPSTAPHVPQHSRAFAAPPFACTDVNSNLF
jgi:hypothetical protein